MAEDFLSNNVAAPHHRKAIGALIASVVIFGIVLAVYFLRPEVEPVPINQPVGWTSADAEAKQGVVDSISTRTAAVLTASELKTKKALLDSIKR